MAGSELKIPRQQWHPGSTPGLGISRSMQVGAAPNVRIGVRGARGLFLAPPPYRSRSASSKPSATDHRMIDALAVDPEEALRSD